MSAKWRRSLAWDDQFFPSWAWPAKAALRALSSIRLAVTLLLGIALWGTLASVPIGLLVRIPSYALVGLSGLACVLAAGAIASALIRLDKGRKTPALMVIPLIAGLAGGLAWWTMIHPSLRYSHTTGEGFMLFKDFVRDYHAVRLRQLPFVEMGELEFYNALPMRLMLMLFVANMITATVRRIEFKFVNIGVLTVHSGIVVLTLGSLLYGSRKIEGDLRLQSGGVAPDGQHLPGPWTGTFFDALKVTLRVRPEGSDLWSRFELDGLPRFNSYGLDGDGYETAWNAYGRTVPIDDRGRSLSLDPGRPIADDLGAPPAGVRYRVVGYAPYAGFMQEPDWVRGDPGVPGWRRDGEPNPLSIYKLTHRDETVPVYSTPKWPQYRGVTLIPGASRRMVLKFDTLDDPSDEYLMILAQEGITPAVRHAMLIEIPSDGERERIAAWLPMAIGPDQFHFSEEIGGFKVEMVEVLDRPDLRIVTPGYEGADTAMSKIRVTTPEGKVFTRWNYARFPEIAQDISDEPAEDGRPQRTAPDPRIRMTHVDCLFPHIFAIRREGRFAGVLTRDIDGSVRMFTVGADPLEDLLPASHPGLTLELAEHWDHAEPHLRPRPTPLDERDNRLMGTHQLALLGVEVTVDGVDDWRRVVWLPLERYPNRIERPSFEPTEPNPNQRTVHLPDGRRIHLMFGRLDRGIPGFDIRLEDFTLDEYDHRGAPRDYRSVVSIRKADDGSASESPLPGLRIRPFTHELSLNAPLRAPFNPASDVVGPIERIVGRFFAGLNPAQLKLSQAGWDPEGWEQTRLASERGELPRPFARFSDLHLGNNPGIYVIASGSILIGIGTPWAFYIKPWILRRRKAAIQRALADAQSAEGANPKTEARAGASSATPSSHPTTEVTP